MKRFLATAMVTAAAASIASSALASGYGPAPFYRPDTDSTASPHWHWGRSAAVASPVSENGYATDVGASNAPGSQSGARAPSPVEPPTLPQQ